ncbi:class I SAM-dependent methyltransferase [Mycoplasmatota bacterium zrk1]
MCKICGAKTIIEYDKDMKCHIHFCNECGFIFKSENDYIDQSTEKDRYSKHNNNFENVGYVNMFEKFLDKIDDFISYEGYILDYGCGPGPVLSEMMSARGAKIKTYDLYFPHSEDYHEYVYDIITLTEVIEHFKDPLLELNKILDLLKKNGLLVIQTLFIQKPFLKWWYRRDHTHISFFDNKVFEKISEILNLKVTYTDNHNIIILQKL